MVWKAKTVKKKTGDQTIMPPFSGVDDVTTGLVWYRLLPVPVTSGTGVVCVCSLTIASHVLSHAANKMAAPRIEVDFEKRWSNKEWPHQEENVAEDWQAPPPVYYQAPIVFVPVPLKDSPERLCLMLVVSVVSVLDALAAFKMQFEIPADIKAQSCWGKYFLLSIGGKLIPIEFLNFIGWMLIPLAISFSCSYFLPNVSAPRYTCKSKKDHSTAVKELKQQLQAHNRQHTYDNVEHKQEANQFLALSIMNKLSTKYATNKLSARSTAANQFSARKYLTLFPDDFPPPFDDNQPSAMSATNHLTTQSATNDHPVTNLIPVASQHTVASKTPVANQDTVANQQPVAIPHPDGESMKILRSAQRTQFVYINEIGQQQLRQPQTTNNAIPSSAKRVTSVTIPRLSVNAQLATSEEVSQQSWDRNPPSPQTLNNPVGSNQSAAPRMKLLNQKTNQFNTIHDDDSVVTTPTTPEIEDSSRRFRVTQSVSESPGCFPNARYKTHCCMISPTRQALCYSNCASAALASVSSTVADNAAADTTAGATNTATAAAAAAASAAAVNRAAAVSKPTADVTKSASCSVMTLPPRDPIRRWPITREPWAKLDDFEEMEKFCATNLAIAEIEKLARRRLRAKPSAASLIGNASGECVTLARLSGDCTAVVGGDYATPPDEENGHAISSKLAAKVARKRSILFGRSSRDPPSSSSSRPQAIWRC